MEEKLVFCDNLRISEKDNKVIIGNRDNGNWLKLTQQCYRIIKDAIDREDTKTDLLNKLYDKEDMEYINKIIRMLSEKDIILEHNKNSINTRQWKSISFAVTKRCNLACRHCCINGGDINEEIIKTSEVFKIIDMILEFNPDSIVITGGEPLIRGDFMQFSKYIRKNYQGILVLMTNGTLINTDNVKSIVETYDQISISIDGYDELSCSKIRGKGVFQKVINNIHLLKKNGCNNISLSSTINKYNYNHSDEFNELNQSLGTTGVMRRYAPVGRGFENKEELMNFYAKHRYPEKEFTVKDSKCIHTSFTSGDNMTVCGALKNQLFIGGDKYIYPCAALHLDEFKVESIDNIINLKEYIINKMYKDTAGYKKYISILPENYNQCKECSINMFCSGCPVYVYLYNKSGILNNFCKSQKKRERIIWN